MLQAINYIHKNGIIHCNLKPSNILVDDYGNIRICDFKKAIKSTNTNINDIKKNKSAMTPCYTAPELFSEDGLFTIKSDLWALGCIMYEIAVGQVPFFEESVSKLISKVINEEPNFNKKELQNYSDDFIQILKRLLDKDPNSRISWNELEKHNFWDLNSYVEYFDGTSETKSFTTRSDSSKTLEKQTSKNGIALTERKKTIDVLRLSRNALRNMVNERDDDYSNEQQENKEVDNADREFIFEGNEDKKNDDYDSDKK